MTHPTDPYRDNPAHREIADLQRLLKAADHDVWVAREARDKALGKVDRLKRDLRYAEHRHTSGVRRTVTAGVAPSALCVVIGHKMGTAPAGEVQTVGAAILAAMGLVAIFALVAAWTDP